MSDRLSKMKYKILAQSIENDINQGGFQNGVVSNNYENCGKESISITTFINKKFAIEVICDPDYPLRAPQVFIKEPVKSDAVDPQTLEIKYKSFYVWLENSTISQLITVIESYFETMPPKTNELLKKAYKIKTEILNNIDLLLDEETLAKLDEQINWENRSGEKNEKAELEILRKNVSAFEECIEKKIGIMVESGTKMLGNLERELMSTKVMKEAVIPNIIEYKLTKMNILDASKNLYVSIKVI